MWWRLERNHLGDASRAYENERGRIAFNELTDEEMFC
jgi:hypothetical protein